MPKYNYIINPGEELPEKLKDVLKDNFSEKQFEKLSKFGGRIQISITAPFSDRKEQNKNLVLDEAFIENLKEHPEKAAENIKELSKKQLTKLAFLIQFPITQKSTTKEIKNSLADYFNSAEKWRKISEGNKPTNGQQQTAP
jgi:hypothetical protein